MLPEIKRSHASQTSSLPRRRLVCLTISPGMISPAPASSLITLSLSSPRRDGFPLDCPVPPLALSPPPGGGSCSLRSAARFVKHRRPPHGLYSPCHPRATPNGARNIPHTPHPPSPNRQPNGRERA